MNLGKTKFVSRPFQAALERMRSRLTWVIIHIPFDVTEAWGTRGQLRLKGEINGFASAARSFPPETADTGCS